MRSARLLAVTVLAVILALSSAQNTFAAVIDQKQENSGGDVFNKTILSFDPIGQEFKPILPILEAVEVRIHSTPNLGDSDTVTLTVRQGTIDGPFVATASQLLVRGPNVWVYFALTPVSVTPNSTYVIRLQATNYVFGWFYYPSNLYPRGVAIENGVSMSGEDHTFRTYGSTATRSPVGGVVVPANTFALIVPWLAVMGLVGCISIVIVVAKKRHR